MFRIGIIGCGKIAQVRHIPEYAASKKAEIKAFFDINYDRAKALAEKYGAVACKSVEDLLSLPLDAVSVCTSNNTHSQYAVAALKKGINVLCEKPMAISLDECIEMNAEAQRSGKILMIGQNQRLTKAHKKAREIVSSGEMGRVISFKTTFGHGGPETWSVDPGKNTWFFDKKKAVMGAMADLGIHKTDLIDYILSDEVGAVTATVRTLDKKGPDGNLISVDDNAICIYEMRGGAVGVMSASWTYYGAEDNSTVLYMEKGIVKIYCDPNHSVTVIHDDGREEYFDTDQIQTNDNQTSSGVIDEFILSLERGYAEISSQSVLPAMKAVFAALESSEKGKRIEIV